MRMPWRGAQNSPTHKSGHLDKDFIWTWIWVEISPPWALRIQSSDHPPHACAPGHAWGPARPPLHHWHVPPLTCATTAATCLETKPCVPTCGCASDQVRASQTLTLLASITWAPRSVCNLHVTLLAYWGVAPKKPVTVERHKHVRVTPFGDEPLLITTSQHSFL